MTCLVTSLFFLWGFVIFCCLLFFFCFVAMSAQPRIVDSFTNANASEVIPATGLFLLWQNATGTPVENSSTLLHIAQGTDFNERLGNDIRVKRVRLHITFVIPSGSTSGDLVRLCVVWDKQPNGAAPAVTDFLQYDVFESFQNWFTVNRFRVLFEEVICVNPPTSVIAGQPSVTYLLPWVSQVEVSVPVRFSGTTGDISELVSGNILVFAISSLGIVETTPSSMSRVYFDSTAA